MKPYLALLLSLVAFECSACQPAKMQGLKKDVEAAFTSKSFFGFADKHGESQRLKVTLQDDYDDKPTNLEFKSIAELSKWFFGSYEPTENMIIPSSVRCRRTGCEYELPELTLHHGVYLLGFKTRRVGRCTALSQLRIYLG